MSRWIRVWDPDGERWQDLWLEEAPEQYMGTAYVISTEPKRKLSLLRINGKPLSSPQRQIGFRKP